MALVLDQVGSWALERHLAHLDAEGLVKRAMREGAYHPRVRYPYAVTITAAGHATLHTGQVPRHHGVVANERYDPKRGEKRALVDDGVHRVFGADGFAGPAALRALTVADQLRAATEGRGRVVALSLKDRGAVLAGGRRPDFVAFYDKRIPGFTTSSYYVDALPDWFLAWRETHPVDGYLDPWTPLEATRRGAGVPDDRPVESAYGGLDRAFPHEPRATTSPGSILRFVPEGTRYLLDLAEAAVDAYDLGADETPDLLSVSVSSTDYVGHVFGAESWEYLDNLIRTDRMLGAFVRSLEAQTSVAVVVTSDHGAAPTSDPPPPRIAPADLLAGLDRLLEARFGPGRYLTGYHVPYVYLAPEALDRPEKDAILDAVVDALVDRDDIALAARSEVAAEWIDDPDPMRRAVAAGIALDAAGPVYVVPAEGVIVDPGLGGGGTNHGTPYPYDTDVPVLAVGAGVTPTRSAEVLDARSVAASLAALLGVPPPPGVAAPVLPGIPAAR